jgi:hypothetical protein
VRAIPVFKQSLVAPTDGSLLSLSGRGEQSGSDELGLAISSDNRGFTGKMQISDLTVSINDAYALGDGTTTVSKGGTLILQVPGALSVFQRKW